MKIAIALPMGLMKQRLLVLGPLAVALLLAAQSPTSSVTPASSVLGLSATLASLTLISATPQQAVVSLTCPTTGAATLAVTDNSGLGITVWDVDSAIFANSNLDTSRPNTILSNGNLTRQIELGQRIASVGSDGNLYSRSLQANTSHTVTATCPSIGPVALNFTTLNIPIGNTYPTPPLFNAAGFGGADYPTVPWANPTQWTVDPMSGIPLRLVTPFGGYGLTVTGQAPLTAFAPVTTGITNLPNILSGTTGSLATFQSVTNAAYVSLGRPVIQDLNGNVREISGFSSNISITDLRIKVCGWGDQSATGDRTVGVTLSTHTGTVIGNEVTIVLPGTTSGAATCAYLPTQVSGWPAAPFATWGNPLPAHNLMYPMTTTANAASGVLTNLTSMPNSSGSFSSDWANGDKIYDSTGTTLYTISSIQSSAAATLQETPTWSGHTLVAANSGFRVRKTTATGQVNVSVSYDLAYEASPGNNISASSGQAQICSTIPWTVSVDQNGNPATGRSANNCLSSGQLGQWFFLLFPDNGETRIIGQLRTSFGGNGCTGNNNNPGVNGSPWDLSSAQTMYFTGVDCNVGNYQITRGIYRGDGRAFTPGYGTFANSDGAATCSGSESQWGNVCYSNFASTTVTDPQSICAAVDSRIPGVFGGSLSNDIVAVTPNYVTWRFRLAQDDAAAYCNINISTGLVGNVTDSLIGTGARWGAEHTPIASSAGSYHPVVMNPLGWKGDANAGPYQATVIRICNPTGTSPTGMNCAGGTWNSNSSLTTGNSTDDYPCPSGICGSTISNTVLVNVNWWPANHNPRSGELSTYTCPSPNTSWSCPSQWAVGDGISTLPSGAPCGEGFHVLAVQVNSNTDIDLWLQRGFYQSPCGNGSFQAAANQWTALAFPSTPTALQQIFTSSSMVWYDSSNTDTTARVGDSALVSSAHEDAGGCPTQWSGAGVIYGLMNLLANPSGFATAATVIGTNGDAQWQSGVSGTSYPAGRSNVEWYPWARQCNATGSERNWSLVQRWYSNGNAGAIGANNGDAPSFSGTTLTLVSGNLYTFTQPFTANAKISPWETWAGRKILQDVSSPTLGNAIQTTDDQKFCYANNAGECRTGSSKGTIYVALASTLTGQTSAIVNNFDSLIPALTPAFPQGNWCHQQDIATANANGTGIRRLTTGLSAPSRMFPFWTCTGTPDGKYAFVNNANDGTFGVMFLAKIPPWPSYDAVTRSSFVQVPITASAATQVEVRFGYEEFGTTSQFYCTTRADACITVASPTTTAPFNFLSDGHSGISCSSGCTVNVPAVSGRYLWYQVFSSPTGSVWTAVGNPQQVNVP